MTKKITFLGIETSCDETAAAVIRENERGTADILSNGCRDNSDSILT